MGFGLNGVYVSLATGGGSFAVSVLTRAAFNPANGWSSQDGHPRHLADINHDHAADLVGFGESGVYTAISRDYMRV